MPYHCQGFCGDFQPSTIIRKLFIQYRQNLIFITTSSVVQLADSNKRAVTNISADNLWNLNFDVLVHWYTHFI